MFRLVKLLVFVKRGDFFVALLSIFYLKLIEFGNKQYFIVRVQVNILCLIIIIRVSKYTAILSGVILFKKIVYITIV